MIYPVTLRIPAENARCLVSDVIVGKAGMVIFWQRLWRREGDEIVATYPDRLTLAAALLGSMSTEEILELLRNENQDRITVK